MGGFGSSGGGGPQQQATPPTLDLQQTSGLTQSQINLLQQNIAPLSEAFGAANRSQETLNRFYGLRTLTDPGEDLGRAMEAEISPRLLQAEKELAALDKLKLVTNKKTGQSGYWIGKGKNKEFLSQADFDSRKSGLQQSVTSYKSDLNRARTYDPVSELTNTFSDQYAMRDRFMGDMQGALGSTSEYGRFQDALRRGLDAQTSDGVRLARVANVKAGRADRVADVEAGRADRVADVQAGRADRVADVQAGRADRVADISAQQVGAGALGGSLMNEAMRRMELQGRLSAQDSRDVTQATRQGMAARGMATGNAALGAELLNRDRYTRQRAFQDMAFASGVQDQDLQRQQLNFNRALEAARSNQSTAAQLSVADLDALMRARMANQSTAAQLSLADLSALMRAREANQSTAAQLSLADLNALMRAREANQSTAAQLSVANLDALMRARTANQQTAASMSISQGNLDQQNNQFNAQQRDSVNRANIGFLGQSAAMSDAERARQLGLQQDMYNFAMGTDPRMMLAGLGSPYANMTSPAASSLTTLAAATQPIYSGGSFSPQQMPPMGGFNTLGALALGGAGAVGGYFLGGPPGAFAGFGAGSSLGGQIR